MTIIEIKNQVMSHFYDNTVFDLEEHGGRIRLDDDLEKIRKEVLSSVLSDLVARGIVVKIESPEKTVWVLTQSFDSFNQSVAVSAPTAEVIADTINEFREANGIPGDECDKTHLSETDLMNLINIVHILLESEKDISDLEEESELDSDEEDEEI